MLITNRQNLTLIKPLSSSPYPYVLSLNRISCLVKERNTSSGYLFQNQILRFVVIIFLIQLKTKREKRISKYMKFHRFRRHNSSPYDRN